MFSYITVKTKTNLFRVIAVRISHSRSHVKPLFGFCSRSKSRYNYCPIALYWSAPKINDLSSRHAALSVYLLLLFHGPSSGPSPTSRRRFGARGRRATVSNAFARPYRTRNLYNGLARTAVDGETLSREQTSAGKAVLTDGIGENPIAGLLDSRTRSVVVGEGVSGGERPVTNIEGRTRRSSRVLYTGTPADPLKTVPASCTRVARVRVVHV